MTRSAATKTIAFYVNSVAKGGGVYSVTPTSGTSAIAIGRALSGLQYVNGRISDVAVYSRPLSAARVAAHHAMRTASGIDTPIALQLSATDPDGDPVTYSAVGLPPGLTLDAATGLITGTVSSTAPGSYAVTVTVSDGSGSSSQSFIWTVTN